MNQCCLVRARAGDPHATEEVVRALHARLTRMAAHYARCCHEDADDLLQEAWAGLLEALPGVDVHIGDPEQYLIRVARWRLLDAVRRARIRRCDALPEQEHAIPDDLLHEASVADFIARLTPLRRAVLACLLAGLTWREAGSALGCTSANIAYHVRQLRRQYAEWNGQPYEEAAAVL